jgi:hypothetical protein
MVGKYTNSFVNSHFYNNILLPTRDIPAYQRDTWYFTSTQNRDSRLIPVPVETSPAGARFTGTNNH